MTFAPVVEQVRVEPRLPDDRIGIEAELAQGRHDLLGDAEMDVAGGSVRPRASQDEGDGPIWKSLGCNRIAGGTMPLIAMAASQRSKLIVPWHNRSSRMQRAN